MAQSFPVTLDAVSYKPLEWTGYTAGDSSAQMLSVYLPIVAPGSGINNGHSKYAWMLWPQKNGATSSPFTLVGGSSDGSAIRKAGAIEASTAYGSSGIVLAGVAWQCLMNGIALVVPRVTAANSANTNGTVPTGQGRLHAMGGTAGYYEGLTRHNARKDVRTAAQFARWKARTATSGVWSKLDPNRWGIMGNSAGADAGAWLACAPTRKYEGGTIGAHAEDTVPNVFVGINFLSTWVLHASGTGTAPNYAAAESGATDADSAGTIAGIPPRYAREFSIAHYMSDMFAPCIAPTWCWSDVDSASNNPNLPFVEDAQSQAHELISMLHLKAISPPGRVYVATGETGVICNTTESFADYVDRADMTGPTIGAAANAAVDDDGVAESALTPAGGGYKAIDHILRYINSRPWDSELPSAGIARRGQVNSTGSIRVPPRANRAGVELACTSRPYLGEVELLYGNGQGQALGIVRPGEVVRVRGQGPLWLQAAGDSTKVARFVAREVASI